MALLVRVSRRFSRMAHMTARWALGTTDDRIPRVGPAPCSLPKARA